MSWTTYMKIKSDLIQGRIYFKRSNFRAFSQPKLAITKVELISKSAPTHVFKLFPANIWIFKLFIMILAVKMCLDNTYVLLNIL